MARKQTPSELREEQRVKEAARLRKNLARANGRKKGHARDISLSHKPRRKRRRASSNDAEAEPEAEVSSVTGDEGGDGEDEEGEVQVADA